MESTIDPPAESSPVESSTFSGGEADVYQSVSRSAIASLLLGIFGLASFLFVPVLLLPIVGLIFSIIAFRGFQKFPHELLGRPLASAGGIVCFATLLFAPAYHTYIYMTEVPEGYQRVDFGVLTSGLNEPDTPTAAARDLNGEQIFIKGYIHPSSMDTVLSKKFVIVPDLGTCCFGGQPPLTHMIEVNLTGDQYARKSYRKQRLAGELRVNGILKKVEGLNGVYYQLRADILK